MYLRWVPLGGPKYKKKLTYTRKKAKMLKMAKIFAYMQKK